MNQQNRFQSVAVVDRLSLKQGLAGRGAWLGVMLILMMAAVGLPQPVKADTIVDRWNSVPVPPPPPLQPVTVDHGHTALLILDMLVNNCPVRPSCVQSIPIVRGLLDAARTHKMLVVYSAGAPTSKTPPTPVPELAPVPGEPMVRAGADKFFDSDLEQTLKARNIDTVIVVGTSAEGSVLYTATGAALRNMTAIVPVDGYSAINPFAELYTAWHLKNAPASVSSHVVLTRAGLISF